MVSFDYYHDNDDDGTYNGDLIVIMMIIRAPLAGRHTDKPRAINILIMTIIMVILIIMIMMIGIVIVGDDFIQDDDYHDDGYDEFDYYDDDYTNDQNLRMTRCQY